MKINIHTIPGFKGVYLVDKKALVAMREFAFTLKMYEFSLDLDQCTENELVYRVTLKPKSGKVDHD